MTLFSTLMAASRRSRRRADGFGSGESVPWDADSFPSHTVKRSIDLASMVPGRDGGEWRPAASGRRARARFRMCRRAVMVLCAIGGLGLVLLSLAQAAGRRPPRSPEPGRRNRGPAGPRRQVPSGKLRRSSSGLQDRGTGSHSNAKAFAGTNHHEPEPRERRARRPAESPTPADA